MAEDQPRLQPWLRAVIYLFLWLVSFFLVAAVFVTVAIAVGALDTVDFEQLVPEQVVAFLAANSLAMGLSTVAVTAFMLSRFDRRPFVSLGLYWNHQQRAHLLFGLALGAGMIGLLFLIKLALGWVTVQGYFSPNPPQFIPIFLTLTVLIAIGAAAEEIMARGYILQNLEQQFGTIGGYVGSAAIFAWLHMLNPGATAQAGLLLFVVGILLAAAYYAGGRSLWLPIGLHFTWNLTEGPILGFPVSGLEMPRILLTAETGPEVLTGGQFGPEGGLLVLIPLAIGAVLLWWWRSRCLRITP